MYLQNRTYLHSWFFRSVTINVRATFRGNTDWPFMVLEVHGLHRSHVYPKPFLCQGHNRHYSGLSGRVRKYLDVSELGRKAPRSCKWPRPQQNKHFFSREFCIIIFSYPFLYMLIMKQSSHMDDVIFDIDHVVHEMTIYSLY